MLYLLTVLTAMATSGWGLFSADFEDNGRTSHATSWTFEEAGAGEACVNLTLQMEAVVSTVKYSSLRFTTFLLCQVNFGPSKYIPVSMSRISVPQTAKLSELSKVRSSNIHNLFKSHK